MRKILFIFLSFIVFFISAQEVDRCYVQKKKSVKMMSKLNQNLPHYSFHDVKNVLKSIQEKEGNSSKWT